MSRTVVGIDFGTLSGRAVVVSVADGKILASAEHTYPHGVIDRELAGQPLPPDWALQVPANGQPVLFLADHPLTGGYPVIGCVAPHHLDLAAQLPPGVFVRFKLMAPFAEIPLEGAGA